MLIGRLRWRAASALIALRGAVSGRLYQGPDPGPLTGEGVSLAGRSRPSRSGHPEEGRSMSIGSMRWRAASALIAAGAATAGVLALAAPAGASTGTTEISPEQAGYSATGAQFQFVRADVFLRQPGQYSSEVASYGHSVQLWSSGLVVTVGVTASTSGSDYTAYATVYDRSTHQVIASNPNAQYCDDHGNCQPGTAVFLPNTDVPMQLSISYDPASGSLGMGEVGPDGDFFNSSYTVTGQSFTQARVGTDFGSTPWDGSYSYTPPAQSTKAAAYSNVTLTTYSGHTSTLWSWWVHHKLLANTEQQSGSDWVAVPTDLTSGGANFQTWFVPQSGQGRAQPVLH